MNSKNSRKKDLRKFRKLRRKTDKIMNGSGSKPAEAEKDIAMSLNTTVIKEKKK